VWANDWTVSPVAAEWFLAAVDTPMSRQCARVRERLPADITDMALLAGVDEDVRREVSQFAEHLVADVARERLPSVVFPSMFPQVTHQRERLAADLTRVRFVSRVDASVCLEVSPLVECPVTLVAFVRRRLFGTARFQTFGPKDYPIT